VFIEAPYDSLVTTSTRFWNASGISATLSAEGAALSVASLETLVAGGVAFDQPEAALPGDRVKFRGIRIGSVQRIMVREGTAGALDDGADRPIPVLIRIQPGRFEMSDSRSGVVRLRESLEQAVANRLGGTLESGNLLTGSLYVNFDFYHRGESARLGEFEGYPEIPTVSGGLDRLQQQVGEVLDEEALQRLPDNLERSLTQLDRTLAAYSSDSGLPDQLSRAIAELNRTLERMQSLADTLERDPNALIFPRQPHRDPEPRAALARVTLAPFLQRHGIVLETAERRLETARDHR